MTRDRYQRVLTITLILLIVTIFLNQVGDKISWVLRHEVLATTIFYAYPILSLFVLYFGVYARVHKIETIRKIYSPVAVIIVGSLLAALSFGRPILGLLLIHSVETEPLTSTELQSVRETALGNREKIQGRLEAAKYYFIQTGESIQYKDENGSTVLYVPSEIVRNERKEHLRVIEDIHKQISLARRVVLNLIILFVLSLSGFLVLLKRKPCSPT